MATVINCGGLKRTTRKLLIAAAPLMLATRGLKTVDEFALRLRDLPRIEVWPADDPKQRTYGPARKGKGGKGRKW